MTPRAGDLGSVFTLNEVGAFIGGLEEAGTKEELSRAVAAEFEVEKEQALRDVRAFAG